MNRSSQQGFTLIELVAVIVLLGILAVTALPRFLNVQTDARISVLNGLVGAMQGAAQQTYARALIQNRTGLVRTTTTSTINGVVTTISVINGFPSANTPGGGAIDIQGLVNISGDGSSGASDIQWGTLVVGSITRVVGYDTNASGTVTAADTCIATYSETLTNGAPTIGVTAPSTAGC